MDRLLAPVAGRDARKLRGKEGGGVMREKVVMREKDIQQDIRAELGDIRRYPELVVWPNVCGVFLDEHSNTKRRVGIGNPGGADLIGLWRMPSGVARFVALEIKTPIGRQSEEQKRFQQLVEKRGGVYAVLRSVDDARRWAEEMRAEAHPHDVWQFNPETDIE